MITDRVLAEAQTMEESTLPAYLYDLRALSEHARAVRAALPDGVELYYAAKANPETRVLQALQSTVDGVEVASGGELQHVRRALPHASIAFGGPAKTSAELDAGLRERVAMFHVESTHELRRLAELAASRGVRADILLRVNLPLQVGDVPLAMGGQASQFGLDPGELGRCLDILAESRWIRLRGLHVHLASGLDAPALLAMAEQTVTWASEWGRTTGVALTELNVGGGMAVDYLNPAAVFDWAEFGAGLRKLTEIHPGLTMRVEPGRSLTAYCGWYVTSVLDVKRSQGKAFALLRGGTHHLRTPAAKGHDHPFQVLPVHSWPHAWPRPEVRDEPVTLAGQLCTPKDVLARQVAVDRLRVGDRIAFSMAGAYAWNISHRDFLMHPPPVFRFLN
jgi:diaminopimelate decarboxylase